MLMRGFAAIFLLFFVGPLAAQTGIAQNAAKPSAILAINTWQDFPIGVWNPVGPMDRHLCFSQKPKVLGNLNNKAWGGGKKVNRFEVSIPINGMPFRILSPIGLQGKVIDYYRNLYEARACVAHMEFTPEADGYYVATIGVEKNECSITIARRMSDDKLVPEPSAKLLPQCFPQKLLPGVIEKAAKESYSRNPELYR